MTIATATYQMCFSSTSGELGRRRLFICPCRAYLPAGRVLSMFLTDVVELGSCWAGESGLQAAIPFLIQARAVSELGFLLRTASSSPPSQDVALPLMRRSPSDVRAIDGDGGNVEDDVGEEDEEGVLELLRAEAGEGGGKPGEVLHLLRVVGGGKPSLFYEGLSFCRLCGKLCVVSVRRCGTDFSSATSS